MPATMSVTATSDSVSAPAVLEIKDAVKTFSGKRALDGVSLTLRRGECLGLLGPNGAGKSTLVRAIMGRVRLDSGSVTALGSPADSPAARAQLGWVPQEYAIYPALTPRENLETFGAYMGLSGKALQGAIDWALEWSALAERASEPAKNFSGGMKRRLNMAAGLLSRAPIVLLDEPTVGVDPQSRERIYAMIEGLRAEGASVIYTSHYMEEVERLCDRVSIIDHGRIIAEGTKAELVRNAFGTRAEIEIRFRVADADAVRAWAAERNGVVGEESVRFAVSDAPAELSELLRSAAAAGVAVENLSLRTPGLQDVFLHLTGKDLRE